jgi:hypothetical protein
MDSCGTNNCAIKIERRDGQYATLLKPEIPINRVECYPSAASSEEAWQNIFKSEPKTMEGRIQSQLPWTGFDKWIYFQNNY